MGIHTIKSRTINVPRYPARHEVDDYVRKKRNEDVPCPQCISGPRDVFQEHVTEPSVFPGSEARDSEQSLLVPLVLRRHSHH